MRRFSLVLLASSALVPAAAYAQELPTGGSVAAGQASVAAPGNGAMTITQGSDRAVLNWQSFSIGAGGRVDIVQPSAQAALLNRVTGDTGSTIAGQLNANGRVFLVNPNGILITPTGSVKAAGFVASSLDIADRDFLAGDIVVTGKGGSVANRGTIAIVKGGYAALIGGRVDNSGLILAPLGRVALGAGTRATLDLAGDGFLQVALPAADGGVTMSGRIVAAGGAVVLSAGQAIEAARGTVNLSGTIAANAVDAVGGTVVLTGAGITLSGASIDVSGASGGSVRIGGDRQGGGTLAHANMLAVDAASLIRADATVTGGTGGNVVLWSDARTDFAGTISARGAGDGDGGQAEVSSKGVLAYAGTADLTGRAFGTLLLDPYNITISTGADAGQAGFTATGNDSVINAATLTAALGTANVTVSTGTAGAQAGNITVTAPLAWTSSATLALQAAGAVNLNGTVDAAAGGLTLTAGGTIGSTAAVSVARFTLAGGNWAQNNATLPGFATADFRVTGGSFLRATGGAGTAASPYLLADIYGVQGMGSSAALVAASYQLAGNIDASGTATWNAGAGFNPIGTYYGPAATPFTGSLDGAGYTIAGLFINRPTAGLVGLIGYMNNGGKVTNIGLLGGSVTAEAAAGSLAGVVDVGGSISRSYSTAAVVGVAQMGGLVGYNAGSISQSYATGAVSSTDVYVGGLVGQNSGGSISQSYATGAVRAGGFAGGLIGYNNNGGTISQSYATGSVNATGAYSGGLTNASSYLGGLVGYNISGTYTANYWDTQTTGQASGVGNGSVTGTTGLTTAQARTAAAYTGFDFTNVWYQSADLRPILRSEAATAVNGVVPVSNLHQLQLMGANLSASYVLTGNIDAAATAGSNPAGIWSTSGFVPVGSPATRFTGSLNGAGYTVGGLVINRPTTNYVGLIGYLDTGGTVSTIGMVGGSISGGNYVGGLIGESDGSVSRSYVTGTVRGVDSVGGLAGGNDGSIGESYVTGAVNGQYHVGGLVGLNFSGTISRSYVTGAVSGSVYVGGLVGGSSYSRISQSYAAGAVSGDTFVGGLAGYDISGTYTANYWDTQTTGQASGVGNGSVTGTTGLTTAQARTAAAYTGFDFTNVWYRAADLRPILRSEAAAAVNGVVPVSNLHQLQLMRANLSASYVLTGNIDAAATAGSNPAGIWSTSGFVPVGNGNGVVNYFTGSLNGAGNTVSGLVINRPTLSYVGLIGYLGSGGTVSDIGLLGGSVRGDNYVGALVGAGSGVIARSYATGTVGGESYLGGLIGNNSGSISQSYATGAVSGGSYLGGLTGSNSGSVTQSYATGTAGGAGDNVGGLVGYNSANSIIGDSYASGSAGSSGGSVGGLVGNNVGIIGRSYATGAVLSTTFVGGLVGTNSGTVTSAYWDTQATRQANAVGSGSASGATGRTTAQMQDLSAFATNYAGFDFAGVWSPPNQVGQNNGSATAYYPQLYALSRVVAVTPSNTSRVYGDANPTVSAYSGVRAGDFVTTPGTVTTTATATSDVGNYAQATTGTAVTGRAGAYRAVAVPASLAVTARPVTVTADAKSRAYGDANPALTYTSSSLGAGAALSGTLATAATATSDVGGYAITQGTLTTAANPNYALTYAGATLSVNQRPVTVTADALSRLYGDANPALTYASTSLGAGAALNGSLATLATATSDVGGYAITQGTLTTAANPNYALSYVGGTLSVAQRPVTVTADAKSRAYGEANPALTYTSSSLGAGAALSGALATAATATSDVGGYAITQGSLTSAANPNYALSYVGNTLTIGQYTITVTADALSRLYGDANPVLTYASASSGAGNALTGALATVATATSNVGGYAITQGSLAPVNANYALSYTGNTLTIAQRPVTVSATALARVYGDANPALAYASTSLGAGAALNGSLATPAVATSDVGSYAITQGTLTPAANPNYALSYVGSTLTVNQRPITVTADALSRLYGDANPALTYTNSSLGAGAALSGTLATAATATSDIGGYAITQGTLTTAANPNYALTYVGGTLTVSQRPVTVTADAKSRGYGAANPPLTYASSSLGAGVALAGSLATDATAASNVGSYAITQGTLTSAANPNYALSFVGSTLSIGQGRITVAADALSRLYGDANPALTYTSFGGGTTLSGGLATTAAATSDVGGYAITQGTLAPTDPNYALSFVGNTLSVVPRPVTVTADPQRRGYGAANPPLTYIASSLGAGAALAGSLATDATAASDVGSYAITQGTLSSAANPNYVLSFVGNFLSVGPGQITVTADALSRLYGDANPALTYTSSGGTALSGLLATTATATSNVGGYAITQGSLVATDPNYVLSFVGNMLSVVPRPVTVAADAGSRTYGDANPALTFTSSALGAGAALAGSLATAATVRSAVGGYAIGPGTVTAANNPNYALTYLAATLTVTPRALVVTPDAVARAYGDANPARGTATADNLVNADTLVSVALGSPATVASGVGRYGLSGSDAAGTGLGNYSIRYATRADGLLVTPRALSVAADAQSRVYGNANPALSYAVGGGGLVNGDALSGMLATAAGTASPIGGYAITQGTLAASANYALAYAGATLTVTPRALVVTPDAVSRAYGDANPATGGASGNALVNGDTIAAVALSTPATVLSGVGGYALTGAAASGTGLGNYTIIYATRSDGLTITPRALAIAADPLGRVYGDANPALTYAVGERGLVGGDRLSGALATAATTGSGVGSYAIAQGTLGAGPNYAVRYTGATLTVAPRPLTVTADLLTRLFGDANGALTYTVAGRGLVGSDTLAGSLATAATPASAPGSYPIAQGSLAASPNYTVTFVSGTLTVEPPRVLPSGSSAGSRQRDGFAADGMRHGPDPLPNASGPDGPILVPGQSPVTACPSDQRCPNQAEPAR